MSSNYSAGMEAYNGRNYKKALRLWRPLGEEGNASAQYMLGVMHNLGQGVPQDHQRAVVWYRKAAAQKIADAQFRLGNAYRDGEGVLRDFQQAIDWYKKAAEQGHVEAQLNLGDAYDRGEGVPKDPEQAGSWYWKAAEQGCLEAQVILGLANTTKLNTRSRSSSVRLRGSILEEGRKKKGLTQAELQDLTREGDNNLTPLSKETISNAERGNSVSSLTAKTLADALDIPLTVLKVRDTSLSYEERIAAKVYEWLQSGAEVSANGLPAHPGLLFRIEGEWTGWNKLLNSEKNADHYLENVEEDAIEDAAIKLFRDAVNEVMRLISMMSHRRGEVAVREFFENDDDGIRH